MALFLRAKALDGICMRTDFLLHSAFSTSFQVVVLDLNLGAIDSRLKC